VTILPEAWQRKNVHGRASAKQEIEFEQSDTDFACLMWDRRIGFGPI
jgi:hypothetical protein